MTEPATPAPASARPLLWTLAFWPLALLSVVKLVALRVEPGLTAFYALHQDQWLLLAVVTLTALCALPAVRRIAPFDLSGRVVAMLSAALGLLAYAGHYLLLAGYELSRDEQMANFDARIYASGKLVQPIPIESQLLADAQSPIAMLPVSHPVAWISAYLPGNSLLRALFGMLGDAALTGPLLTALAAIFLWKCARLLWPDDRETAVVSLAMLALSGQVLMAGMTAYAMPAHLCANLLWLWLFLQNRRRLDIAALLVGFVATGLHQPVFHPLFVAPWLFVLLRKGAWRRLALFVSGYGVISLFWLAWPLLTQTLIVGPQSVTLAEGTDIVSRIRFLLNHNGGSLPFMASNLLRFVAWQPVVFLPLFCAGWVVARQDRDAMALAGGLVLTALAMELLLPFQGHGFGYRYFHGLLGNGALLAAFGWRSLALWHERLRPIFVRAGIATVIIILPTQATMALHFYAPYAAADARIAASGADYAVIGERDARYALDLAHNRADLSNRPIRLVADLISDPAALAQRICRPGVRVAVPQATFYAPIDQLFGAKPSPAPGEQGKVVAAALNTAGCTIVPLN